MNYVLGIDFGGGASKATLLSEKGEIVSACMVEYPTMYPKPGHAEQNPADWYDATRTAISTLLKKSGIRSESIAALSLDAATHTAVLADENFNVLRPAIYWTDSRSVEEVRFLKDHYADLIEKQILHKPDTIWTLPQILWVGKHEREIWKKTRRIMFAKDYVRHQLTGDYATDRIEAQGSMFFDYNTMNWSQELCEAADLNPALLPELVNPTDIVGKITRKAAEETGLQEGTPVLCGTTDTAMEVFASGAVAAGQITIKLATAGRICVITDKAYPDRNLINYSHVVNGLWYPGTATKSCAASYRWYRDTLGGAEDYRELDHHAAEIPVGCDGLMFHPYLNGELTPYADPLLCGSFTGVRALHGKPHFTRAVLEGVALSMLDCKKALEAISIPHEDQAIVIGGGSASPLWRQILSDTLGMSLIRKENSDSSFGSAMLAGSVIGMFGSLPETVRFCSKEKSRTVPDPEKTDQYEKMFAKYKAIHDALAPIYHGETV
ncbi:MAG: xylulokinase [Planctomycetia bacterium]|nr:xylulokinase [Planctomycetia bacterium]